MKPLDFAALALHIASVIGDMPVYSLDDDIVLVVKSQLKKKSPTTAASIDVTVNKLVEAWVNVRVANKKG